LSEPPADARRPLAVAYETPKMWRVRKAGRTRLVTVRDLLDASDAVRTVLEELGAALRG
jgi:hypothetical protein